MGTPKNVQTSIFEHTSYGVGSQIFRSRFALALPAPTSTRSACSRRVFGVSCSRGAIHSAMAFSRAEPRAGRAGRRRDPQERLDVLPGHPQLSPSLAGHPSSRLLPGGESLHALKYRSLCSYCKPALWLPQVHRLIVFRDFVTFGPRLKSPIGGGGLCTAS